ncbi:hypothetical protein BBD42_00195 [Paenibacillus sp. BIHB 4019]|uniref:Uncharacterized protein n=1 Tax=Paenibacillus sp. BIHB 4019 TaxID=1870819 RepID=A0A1B2DBI3_9BACL|nr:hypothetical protein [Paenibacillus sp. BIHB 4019]ANY65070.1 hypothetical protein BBD42_00195 [Paenibacillus sp. BIHB 4019]
MVEEFEFFRKVQLHYCQVRFHVRLSYTIFHKKEKLLLAHGILRCRVEPHSQMVEYRISLESEAASRPYSEKATILFSTVYEEIPQQSVKMTDVPAYQLRYSVPIVYDWQAFIIEGMSTALSKGVLQPVFDKYRFVDKQGKEIDAKLKVAAVMVDWYNESINS